MVTVSHLVNHVIMQRPYLEESLSRGIINYAALAEELQYGIESELGKRVNISAIVMALRRHAEKIKKKARKKVFDYDSEVIVKTKMCDVAVLKSQALFRKLKDIYAIVDYSKGDTLNVIHGNYEISIIIGERHLDDLMKILHGEKVINVQKNLVSLAVKYDKEYSYTPGILFTITRLFAWENVNIFELISTLTELNCIISEKDMTRAYAALQNFIKQNKGSKITETIKPEHPVIH
jgi:hypothetical protein